MVEHSDSGNSSLLGRLQATEQSLSVAVGELRAFVKNQETLNKHLIDAIDNLRKDNQPDYKLLVSVCVFILAVIALLLNPYDDRLSAANKMLGDELVARQAMLQRLATAENDAAWLKDIVSDHYKELENVRSR